MSDKGCMLCSLTWLYELFVGTLLSLANAYASCGRSTLNCIERLTWVREAEGFSPESAKRSEFRKWSHFKCTVCTDYVELFSSVNVNLKMLCILCLLILCIILCSTSKTSENLCRGTLIDAQKSPLAAGPVIKDCIFLWFFIPRSSTIFTTHSLTISKTFYTRVL